MKELCQWFALCDNEAQVFIAHPLLGKVPTCIRCADIYMANGGEASSIEVMG